MELDYELHGETAKIFYAETLVSQLKSLKIEQSVLFLTNQRYYDLFADKINQLFANPRKIDWYICANTQCNHLIELAIYLLLPNVILKMKHSSLLVLDWFWK